MEFGIKPELLEEQILYFENNEYKVDSFVYIYDNNHEKLYYDENADGGNGSLVEFRDGNFFTIDPVNKTRKYLDTSNEIRAGSERCKYKTVSVLWGTTDGTTKYKKLYLALNGYDKGKWFMNVKDEPDNWSGNEEAATIDTQVSGSLLVQLGLNNINAIANTYTHDIRLDYSGINYYVESYAFGNWVKENLIGVKQQIYNETTRRYEAVPIKVEGSEVDIFKIDETNNPEEKYSPIVIHKKELMKESVTTNLNLAISNYGKGSRKI